MDKLPEDIDPEEDVALTALQALKYEDENPQGCLFYKKAVPL